MSMRMPDFWSYSRYAAKAKCNFMYACRYIFKGKDRKALYPTPPNWAMERGTTVHLKGEQYLLGNISGVPKEFKHFATEMRTLRRMGARPEVPLTVDRNWEPCGATDWGRAWLRAKADAEVIEDVTLDSIDFKTGKKREDSHTEQGEVCAVTAFATYPGIEVVNVEFWYLDHDDVLTNEYERDKHYAKLKKKWDQRGKKMLAVRSADALKPQPSEDACRFCDYRSDKTLANGQPGPCDGWRKVL